jgi:hypothetical protein
MAFSCCAYDSSRKVRTRSFISIIFSGFHRAKAISNLVAALIGRGMDVEMPLTGHQVGGLGISQPRLSFERTFADASEKT